MRDFSYLNSLAVDFATLELDDESRERIYQELYQGSFEFLMVQVPLKVEGLETSDIVIQLAESQLPTWIQQFSVNKQKKFLNYISNHARHACKNIFRDSRGLQPSARAYDRYQRIQTDLRNGRPMEEALNEHLYHAGIGLKLQKQVECLLASALDPVSLSAKFTDKDGGSSHMTIEDRLVYNETFEVEREASMPVDHLPERYKNLLEQLRPGVGLRLHEIDFGRPMSLVDELVMLDNALRMAVRHRQK